jgi:hypothetical protein
VGRGPLQEQVQQPRSLSGRQARRPAGSRFRPERIRASGLDLGLPSADGCWRAADFPGHFPYPEAIFEERDGPAAPGFQCGGIPIWSHTSEDTIVPLFTQESIDTGVSTFIDNVSTLIIRVRNRVTTLREQKVRDTLFLDYCRDEISEAFNLLCNTSDAALVSLGKEKEISMRTLTDLKSALGILST